MSVTQLTTVLESTIALALLLVVLLRLWPEHRCDAFRQQMFTVRDELFDYAAAGNIGFDDPAYLLLRRSMNGFIRYAHQLTFFRLCLTLVGWRILGQKPDLKWAREWEAALKRIKSPDVEKSLREFHTRTIMLVVKRLVSGSPVLLGVLLVTALNSGFVNLRQACVEAASRIVSRFVDTRLLEEEAARA